MNEKIGTFICQESVPFPFSFWFYLIFIFKMSENTNIQADSVAITRLGRSGPPSSAGPTPRTNRRKSAFVKRAKSFTRTRSTRMTRSLRASVSDITSKAKELKFSSSSGLGLGGLKTQNSASTDVLNQTDIENQNQNQLRLKLKDAQRNKYQWEEYAPKVKVSKQQFHEILEVFLEFDLNNDGVISRKEFFKMLRSIGQNPKEKELDKLFDQLDINMDCKVDFMELITLVEKVMSSKKEDVQTSLILKHVYTMFDQSLRNKPTRENYNGKMVAALDVKEVCMIIENIQGYNGEFRCENLDKDFDTENFERPNSTPKARETMKELRNTFLERSSQRKAMGSQKTNNSEKRESAVSSVTNNANNILLQSLEYNASDQDKDRKKSIDIAVNRSILISGFFGIFFCDIFFSIS